MKCKICNKDCGKYAVCYQHKNTKYKDICRIHGRTDFINRQCLKCEQLKKPIYLIIDNKDRFGNIIDKDHYLYPYLDRLTNLYKSYQSQYIQRISKSSGIYGIFYNNICLYIGQSTCITLRVKQHKKNFVIAQNHIKGIKLHKKRISIKNINRKVEYKYYELANNYNLSDLSFKKLFNIPKSDNEFEYNELLTYAEQAMMNTYKPKYNHIAARPSKNIKMN